jgi:hypothetical protein
LRLCDCAGWPDNDAYRRLVACCWSSAGSRHLVVDNLSDAPAAARVRLSWTDLAGRSWTLADRLDERRFERAGDEFAGERLYVALDACGLPLPPTRGLASLPAPAGRTE